MQRMGYKPIGFVATEYALAIWSMNEVEDINILLNEDIMLDDLYEWLEETPLLKKNFRDAAIISCLIDACIELIGIIKKKNITNNFFIIKEFLFYQHDLLY